jgi:ubiquinone/menaquinone biosynthesis C-methylase UbiE
MSTKEEPRENAYILPTDSDAEMARLINQDQVISGTTGLLPHSLVLHNGDRILDVACGPGGWARTLALQYPGVQVVGIDISQTMLAYANASAQAQHLPNISFQLMDVTKPWPLADASFDLVNARLMIAFLNDEKWQQVIAEMLRVLAPGGTIILAETDDSGHTNSPALETLALQSTRAARRAGLSQHPLGHHFGITPLLGSYLQQAGVAQIQQEAHVIDFSAGAPAHRAMVENLKVGYALAQPYMVRQGMGTQQELDELDKQLPGELESPDFRGLLYVLRIWGKKPVKEE